MSQYFHIANNTTKEYLNDHAFHGFGFVGGHGIDFGSIMGSRFGSLQLLAILLSSDIGFGARTNPPFAGDWQGDSIAMYGDWGSEIDYERVCRDYADITPKLIAQLLELPFWRQYMESTRTDQERMAVERTASPEAAKPTEAKP